MSILKVRDKDGNFVDVPVISGRPASIKVGEVKLLEPNSEPTIENVGTEYDAIFNFGIPKGEYIVEGENFKLDLSDYAKQKQLDREIQNRQQTDNNLQSQIKSLASGSPKGVYTDVTALKTANPETGVYITSDNGHIYSWTKDSESDPIDLGVYQAVEIREDSIVNTMIRKNGVLLNNLMYENNIIDKATAKYENTELYAYDTTSFLPQIRSNKDYSTYFFDTHDLEEVITLPFNPEFQYIQVLFYKENVDKSLIHTTSWQGGYDFKRVIKDYFVNIDYYREQLGYEKVAICVPNNSKFIYENKYNGLSFAENVNYRQKISGKNITGIVPTNKIDLSKYDLSVETQAFTVLKNKRINGYIRETLTPSTLRNFSYDVYLIDLGQLSSALKENMYCYFDVDMSNTEEVYFIAYKAGVEAAYITNADLISNGFITEDKYLNMSKAFALIQNSHPDLTHIATTIPNDDNNDKLKLYSVLSNNNNPNTLDIDYKIKPILPNKVKTVVNKNFLIFHQNVLKHGNIDNIALVTTNRGYNFKNFTYINNSLDGTREVKYNVYIKDLESKLEEHTIELQTVPTNAGNGLNKKILLIGDSITARDVYPLKLKELFDNDVMKITMLGTQGGTGHKHEGRAGWRAYTYCNCQNGTEDNDSGITGNNPFYNPTTNTFDFSYYMTQQSYQNIDYVFINLGTNDVARNHHTSKNEIISYYNTIINSIKSYNSNVKIGLWLPPCRGIKNNAINLIQRDNALVMHEYLLEEFSNRENENLYLVPVYLQINPDMDYPISNIDISDNYSVENIIDNIHPANSGMHAIANVIYYWIKYFGSIDS